MNQKVLPRPGRLCDVDPAAHQRDEPLRDGEAEAGAAVAAAGRAVRLDEGLEEARLQLGVDADAGVAHLEADDHRVPGRLVEGHPEDDLARLRELDRVADEVGEDLAQPAGVAPQRVRHVVADEAEQLEPLGLRGLGEGAEHLAHRAPQVELDALEVDAARLDLREVEDVVDDLEQRPPRLVDHLGVLALLGGEAGVEEEPGHPDDAVHRGADLVAHVRHELRLEARGLEGGLAGPHQDVDALHGQHHPGHRAVGVAPGVHGPAQEDAGAVLALERVLGVAHHLAGEGPLEHLAGTSPASPARPRRRCGPPPRGRRCRR